VKKLWGISLEEHFSINLSIEFDVEVDGTSAGQQIT
jgi:hypothetical protein